MDKSDELKRQRDRLLMRAVKVAEFLERLAVHLEDSEMPGQAGNCIIHAKALRQAMKGSA